MAPRPKRAAEDVSRVRLHDDGPSSKKPRFDYRNPSTLAADQPDEDTILDLDEIGKGGAPTKRNAVELDGYESDSSTENFETRAEARAHEGARAANKSKDEAMNDMFDDLDEECGDGDADEDLAVEGKKKKKEVRFMNENEIEGQVSSSKSGGHVSADFSLHGKQAARTLDRESSSDESADEEERDKLGEVDEELGAGAKKKHAPRLDAFNMHNEAEEGKFDNSGNFVRKATDPHAVHDTWLEDTSKAEIKRAREAHEKREEERRQKDLADDAISTSETLSVLIGFLQQAETVLEALARLGKEKEKKKPRWQRNRRRNDDTMEIDEGSTELDKAESKRKETVEAITAAADRLLTRGQLDVYEAERAALLRQYRKETGEEWQEPSQHELQAPFEAPTTSWFYRWSDARDGLEKHGPYGGEAMQAWYEAGYFGDGVVFRQTGTEGWSASVDFV